MQLVFPIMGLAARLLTALGVACVLLGGYLSWRTLAFANDAQSALGQVVSHREVRDGEDVRYRPRVRFQTVTGEIVQFDGQLATAVRRFEPGSQVPVVYPAHDPLAARIASFTDNWLGVCVAGVVGLVSFAAGLLLRRAARREAAQKS